MSEVDNATLLHRLKHTPMRDLVRGRISQRLDWRGMIDAAELSDEAKTLLTKLVKRTRLWRLEKVDVARELVGHFEDALENGQFIEEVLDLFGDWKRAAKLIRRAKKRNRPLLWHAWRLSFWSTVGLIGLYIGIGVYFAVSGERHIATDYAQAINADAAAVAESDRGWPVFRDAMVPMYHDPVFHNVGGVGAEWIHDEEDAKTWSIESLLNEEIQPGHAEWSRLAMFLDQHRADLDHVREAAAMPGLGYVSRATEYAVEDLPLFAPESDPQAQAERVRQVDSGEPQMVMGVGLWHLHIIQTATKLLYADALLALERGDRQTAYNNIVSILQLAGHADEQHMLINQFVAIALYTQGDELISRLLYDYRDALTDEQLRGLAHRVAAVRVYPFDFSGEKIFMLDMIQRVYTDDGHGSGHLDPEGWFEYRTQIVEWQFDGDGIEYAGMYEGAFVVSTLPAFTLFTADRREMTAEVEHLYAMYQADLSMPMHEQPLSAGDRAISDRIHNVPYYRKRFPLVADLMPAVCGVREASARYTANADATLAALALELYRREFGAYPDALDTLVPRFLPAVPIDPITGGPMLYRVGDDGPVLYSVGADRDDDGGSILYDAVYPSQRDQNVAQWVLNAGDPAVDGDWVLWPIHDDRPAAGVVE